MTLLMHNLNESQSIFKIDNNISLVDFDDPFQVTQQVCLQLDRGIFVLFVANIKSSFETISSYSNTFQIPFMHARLPKLTETKNLLFQIALKPFYLPAIIDIIKYYHWKEIIYLYTSDDGLYKLQYIFGLINENYTLQLRAVRRIHNASDANTFLSSLEMSDPESRKYVLLDCDSTIAKDIIVAHVRDIYMGRRNFHFLLTSLVSTH